MVGKPLLGPIFKPSIYLVWSKVNYLMSFYCSCPHYFTLNFLNDHAKNSFVQRTMQWYDIWELLLYGKLTLSAAFQRVSQSSFGIILKTNSELNSVSKTLMSLACKDSEEQINLICHIHIHIHWWFLRHWILELCYLSNVMPCNAVGYIPPFWRNLLPCSDRQWFLPNVGI